MVESGKTELKSCPASIPDTKRIVVPELPQSQTQFGTFKTPSEDIFKVLSLRNSMLTPKSLNKFRVEWQSAPLEKLRTIHSP